MRRASAGVGAALRCGSKKYPPKRVRVALVGTLQALTESSSFMRPCCVTASVWSVVAPDAGVSRKQAVAVGHLLKRELFGSFVRLADRWRSPDQTQRSEVSVLSDKAPGHEALDFADSLRSASSLCVTALKRFNPALCWVFFVRRRQPAHLSIQPSLSAGTRAA